MAAVAVAEKRSVEEARRRAGAAVQQNARRGGERARCEKKRREVKKCWRARRQGARQARCARREGALCQRGRRRRRVPYARGKKVEWQARRRLVAAGGRKRAQCGVRPAPGGAVRQQGAQRVVARKAKRRGAVRKRWQAAK